MKNILVSVGLVLALICVKQIWAQEEARDISETAAVSIEQSAVNADEKDNDFKVDINFDDEDELSEETIGKIGDVLRKVAGKDVAEEVVIELKGLSDEEKAEVAEAFKEGIDFDENDIPAGAVVLGVLAIILIFGTPIFVLIAVFIYLSRKRRSKMDVIQVYVNAGKDVPHELLKTIDNETSSFRSGIMLLGTGLGVLVAFNAGGNSSVGALGLIPMFIGIAKLVYWFFEERKADQS